MYSTPDRSKKEEKKNKTYTVVRSVIARSFEVVKKIEVTRQNEKSICKTIDISNRLNTGDKNIKYVLYVLTIPNTFP